MKYTLIIDGHNFLFRTLYVLPQKKGQLLLSDKETQDLFVSKLSQNINSTIREMQPLVDRCIIAFDSKSWRNNIKSDVSYKGTRRQDETIDWAGFDKCYGQFIDIVKKYNISVSKTKSAEADDLIFMWSTALNAKNIPVIIYSSDKDMLQLVSNNTNNIDTLLWSEVTKKVYVPAGFNNLRDKEDIPFLEAFTKGSASIDIYDRFANIEQSIRKRKLEKIEVDHIKFVYNKILVGDKSDNISSVWSYTKNSRTYNITDAKAEKILEKYIDLVGVLHPEFLYMDDMLNDLAKSVVEVIPDSDFDIVLNNIKRNISYMVLSKKVIPESVIESMVTDIHGIAKELKKINFAQVSKDEEPVVKRSEKMLSGIDDSDMSFIKKTEKPLF